MCIHIVYLLIVSFKRLLAFDLCKLNHICWHSLVLKYQVQKRILHQKLQGNTSNVKHTTWSPIWARISLSSPIWFCQSPDIPRQNVFLSSETSVIRCFQIKNALSEITPTPIFVCFEQTALLVITEYKFKLFLRI